MTDLENKVKVEVHRIIDPETGMPFGQIGLITGVKEQKPGAVKIDFIPTGPFCPSPSSSPQTSKPQPKKYQVPKKLWSTFMITTSKTP